PNSVPMISGNTVNSGSWTPAGMYGRKVVRYGFSGLNPMRSGNSCAAAASPGVMASVDISSDLRTSFAKQGRLRERQSLLYTRLRAKGKTDGLAVIGQVGLGWA